MCGDEGTNEEWMLQHLQEVIVTDHGYNRNSEPFRLLLRYMSELDKSKGQRSKFLRFITGSNRLPVGGFSGLEPRLTIVLKKPQEWGQGNCDKALPSVMTC